MKKATRVLIVALACGVTSTTGSARVWAAGRTPPALKGSTVVERLGKRVDLGLQLTDHRGRTVRLGDYLKDGKPVLLTLNYYRCQMLCSLELNALTKGLKALGWKPGKRFRVVTVSIDHRETVELAAAKRKRYLQQLGLGDDADWSFHVAKREVIAKLADQLGFKFRYDPKSDQFAHPAVIFFVGPKGVIARYLYGISFPARQIKFALIESAAGRIGSTVDRVILSCFRYDPKSGSYATFALGVMRLGGAIVLLAVGTMLAIFYRRERAKKHRESTA